jgi:hypothetical protein
MSIQTDTVKTESFDTISATSLSIGNSATNINVGGSSTTVNMGYITNSNNVKNVINYVSTQTVTLSISDFLTNGTIFVFTYSSANPSTINDLITINLPAPIAQIEGMFFFFRKLRGFANTSTTNCTFNTIGGSYIIGNAVSLTSSVSPATNTLSNNGPNLRLYVLGYSGSYYWVVN